MVEQSAPATASYAALAQTPGETPADVPAAAEPTPDNGAVADTPTPGESSPSDSPGFSERGRMRRRARFLRKARELAYRDLGGLVFNLHRFGQRNDALVLAKLSTLGQIDTELRTLEGALAEHQSVTVLRDAGIAACPRCAAIHGSEDRFCPNCGLAMDRRAERPVAGAPASVAPAPAPAPTSAPATSAPATSAPAPTPPAPTPAPGPSPAQAAAPSPATTMPAASAPPAPATAGSPPEAPAPGDYTTIDRPAPARPRSPQTPAPASPASPATPASPAPGAPVAEPTDQDQPTVIVRPPRP